MKKSISIIVVALVVAASVAPLVYAAQATSGPINTRASVAGGLSQTIVIRKNNSAGAIITTIDFGQLADIGTGTLRSDPNGTTGTGDAVAFITPNSQGLPYVTTVDGTVMSNGTTTLPNGALVVVPVYATQDNGGLAKPSGATLGTAGSWVGTGKVLYQSESGIAAARTFQAHFSVTDDPTAGSTASVPLSQASGQYAGTVTITTTA